MDQRIKQTTWQRLIRVGKIATLMRFFSTGKSSLMIQEAVFIALLIVQASCLFGPVMGDVWKEKLS